MSPEAMEFGVIVVSGILIVSVVYQLTKMWLKHKERR